MALAQQKLAHIELLRGHVDRAAGLLPKAEAFWATAPERYREQRLEGLFVHALLQRNRGDLAGSIATSRQAIAERIAFSGEIHRETALLHNSLAITLTGANRLDDALQAYRKTLAIYERLGLSDELDALVILGNTGTLAFRTGRLLEAEKVLKTAYEKQRERAGDSAAVAAAMGLYGAALTARGQAPQAAQLLQVATDMAVRFTGSASPLAIQDRMFLGEALATAGDVKAARRVAEENLGHAKSRFGDAGLLTLRARLAIARLQLQEGDAAASHAVFAELAPAFEKLGPPAQTQHAHALVGVGDALLAQGKAADAVAPLRQALALREKLLWAESWEVAQARARLGEAMKVSGKGNEGNELLREGLKHLQAQLGEAHPQALRAKAALGAPSPPGRGLG